MESLGHESHSLPNEKMLGEVEVVIRTKILAAFFFFILFTRNLEPGIFWVLLLQTSALETFLQFHDSGIGFKLAKCNNSMTLIFFQQHRSMSENRCQFKNIISGLAVPNQTFGHL